MIKENWRKWAVLEGLMKTASSSFQKIAGSASSNFAGTLLVAGIIGLTQVIFALTYLLIKKEGLLIDRKGIFGSMLFGLVAFSSTVFGIITFLKGGDVSVNTVDPLHILIDWDGVSGLETHPLTGETSIVTPSQNEIDHVLSSKQN
jgi:hypothetical protein